MVSNDAICIVAQIPPQNFTASQFTPPMTDKDRIRECLCIQMSKHYQTVSERQPKLFEKVDQSCREKYHEDSSVYKGDSNS
jgi:hypothetical protein